MSKTTIGTITGNGGTAVRSAVAAADSATITVGNFPIANATACIGWKSVWIFPRFVNGTTPNVVVQVLRLSSGGWIVGEKSIPLTEGAGVLVDVMGRDTFFRIDSLGGGVAADSVTLYAAGFEPFEFQKLKT